MKAELIMQREIGKVLLEVWAYPENTDPLDTIDFGDKKAEQEYVQAIEAGSIPWWSCEVRVSYGPLVGSDFLGCCDFEPNDNPYFRDMVGEAIRQLRETATRNVQWAEKLRN